VDGAILRSRRPLVGLRRIRVAPQHEPHPMRRVCRGEGEQQSIGRLEPLASAVAANREAQRRGRPEAPKRKVGALPSLLQSHVVLDRLHTGNAASDLDSLGLRSGRTHETARLHDTFERLDIDLGRLVQGFVEARRLQPRGEARVVDLLAGPLLLRCRCAARRQCHHKRNEESGGRTRNVVHDSPSSSYRRWNSLTGAQARTGRRRSQVWFPRRR
jgi:hypothetical protein